MRLTVLAVVDCPNAQVLEERLVGIVGGRADVAVSRVMISSEDEAARWLPGADVADDEGAAVGVGLHQSAVGAGLEGGDAGASLGELEEAVGLPPVGDLLGESGERSPRRDGHSKRHEDP